MRDDVFNDCLYHYNNNTGGTPFWADLARKWGYPSGEDLRGKFKNERNRRKIPPKGANPTASGIPVEEPEKTTYKEDNNSIHIVCASDQRKTKEQIIEEYDINTDIWECDLFEVKTSWGYRKDRKVQWEIVDGVVINGKVDDSGKMLVVPFYNIRMKFIKKTLQHISLEDVIRYMENKEIHLPNITPKSYNPEGEVLEIIFTDTHLGSDANHSPEKRLSQAVDDTIEMIGTRKFSKVYLSLLGDIFHYDNMNKTTTAGTIVTTNGMTPYETFDLGVNTILDNALKLASLFPLEIVSIPGNHDAMVGYTLAKVLEAYFRNTDSVILDTKHSKRKFRRIGKNLLAWMHGEMSEARAMKWLQVEAAKEWGQTQYREIHAGNFHSRKSKEDGGQILMYVSGMTDNDGWHDGKGFVGAVRGMPSFVWDENRIGWKEHWFTPSK